MLLMVYIFFCSCSPELQEKIDELAINPPDWIQGTWITKDESSANPKLKFTHNALIKKNEDESEFDIMSSYVFFMGFTGELVTVEEFNTQSMYGIMIKAETLGNASYTFTKISDQEISWDNAPPLNDAEIYIKQ